MELQCHRKVHVQGPDPSPKEGLAWRADRSLPALPYEVDCGPKIGDCQRYQPAAERVN